LELHRRLIRDEHLIPSGDRRSCSAVTFAELRILIAGGLPQISSTKSKRRAMKKIISLMAMCVLAGSLNMFAQDNMKQDNKDQMQSSDSMKHDSMSGDSMKGDSSASKKKSSSKKKKSSQSSMSNDSMKSGDKSSMQNDNMKGDQQQDQMKH
jgi:pentapeptide MXKDX repeat protein